MTGRLADSQISGDLGGVPTSERILLAALDLFSTRGYDATSVREICEAAGITKPTLYHFYGSKEGVYLALVQGMLEEHRQELLQAVQGPGTPVERLRDVARGYFAAGRDHARLMRLVFSLVHNPPSSAPPTDIPKFYASIVGMVAGVVEEGVARGELAPGRTELRMLVLMGALGEAVVGSLLTGQPALTPELADALVDTVIQGWLPRP
jgi:TetR/AcrR family transcriptional regulator